MPSQFEFFGQWHEGTKLYFVNRKRTLRYRFNHWAAGITHTDADNNSAIIHYKNVKFKLMLFY